MNEKRIKVTGYINPEDMDPTHLDENDPTGLSSLGYDEVRKMRLSVLEDLDIEVVDDE